MENKQLKDEDDIMVTLNLDNGQDVECKILTIFEARISGKMYYKRHVVSTGWNRKTMR